jgi:AhpD family alkylhydroperoxidase
VRIRPILDPAIDLDQLDTSARLMAQMRGIFAHRPLLAKAAGGIGPALDAHATLKPRLRELVRLRIAYRNQCRVCMSIRYESGRADGVTEELVCEIERPMDSTGLSERERLAIDFADRFANDHLSIDQSVFDRLHRVFDDGEIVELGMICAHFVGNGRFMAVMDVEEGLPQEFPAPWVQPLTPWGLKQTIGFG